MKKLTDSQKAIINSITDEFNRINSSAQKGGKFNLINAKELIDINEEIRLNEEEKERHKNMWQDIADAEAERIACLLREDLPMLKIHTGTSTYVIGKGDVVFIGKDKHPNALYINVVQYFGEYIKQSHGCGYQQINKLGYSYGDTRAWTIEELIAKSDIVNNIRTKLLSK